MTFYFQFYVKLFFFFILTECFVILAFLTIVITYYFDFNVTALFYYYLITNDNWKIVQLGQQIILCVSIKMFLIHSNTFYNWSYIVELLFNGKENIQCLWNLLSICTMQSLRLVFDFHSCRSKNDRAQRVFRLPDNPNYKGKCLAFHS